MRLEVKNGEFTYGKEKNLFEKICFWVEKGEIMTILGPNGAGKTTLLKCTTSLLKWGKGTTLINHQPLNEWGAGEVWKKMAYVPQSSSNVFSYTVLDMVLMGRAPYLNLFSVPSEPDVAIARSSLETVGISYLEGKRCSEISGGEMQLVLIARALTSEPNILILDEPESHLDFKNQLLILEILKKIAKRKGISCIINTHFPAHALQISDKTLMLGKGRQYLFGKTEEVITENNLRDFFGVNVKILSFENKGEMMKTVVPLAG